MSEEEASLPQHLAAEHTLRPFINTAAIFGFTPDHTWREHGAEPYRVADAVAELIAQRDAAWQARLKAISDLRPAQSQEGVNVTVNDSDVLLIGNVIMANVNAPEQTCYWMARRILEILSMPATPPQEGGE